jgi:hypothetical protein
MDNQFIETLISHNLSLEGFLVLYCLYHNKPDLLKDYTTECRKIDTEVFNDLERKNLIKIKENVTHIYYEFLSLTDDGNRLCGLLSFNKSLSRRELHTSESNFDIFRKSYPSVVRSNGEIRRLHGNPKRCKKLYDKLLMETTHDILCRCAELYHEEHKQANKLLFMQNLETWLNKKMYTTYLEELEKNVNFSKNDIITDLSDDI